MNAFSHIPPQLEARLRDIGRLPQDWNSYGAARISPWAIAEARMIANEAIGLGLPVPAVSPASGASVGIEWQTSNADLVIDRRPPPGHQLPPGQQDQRDRNGRRDGLHQPTRDTDESPAPLRQDALSNSPTPGCNKRSTPLTRRITATNIIPTTNRTPATAIRNVATAAAIGAVTLLLVTTLDHPLTAILAASAATVLLIVFGFRPRTSTNSHPAARAVRSLTSRESVPPHRTRSRAVRLGHVNTLTVRTVVQETVPIVVLILAFALISAGIDRSGFFRYVTALTLQHSRGSINRLVISIFLLSSTLTYFLSNDIVILIMTPIALDICRQPGLEDARRILPLTCFIAANTSSMGLLFGSPHQHHSRRRHRYRVPLIPHPHGGAHLHSNRIQPRRNLRGPPPGPTDRRQGHLSPEANTPAPIPPRHDHLAGSIRRGRRRLLGLHRPPGSPSIGQTPSSSPWPATG